ncbi:hypothetical protein BDN72DRAFT_776652 [Pluteus cervinus]|uniref:Uncharacterized protein n=1 Tax=Pluteus cervinus TaxID=181527 RepID=A0ACD3AB57_9AGAR|nr:hypothetical protein BDN72DRAFT_776652 [Pluteus cervinus]
MLAVYCDAGGFESDPAEPPQDPPYFSTGLNPFLEEAQLVSACFFFNRLQASGGDVSHLMEVLRGFYKEKPPPFADADDLLSTIDNIPVGGIPWQGFSCTYQGDLPANAPKWKTKEYSVWYRDPLKVMEEQIGNADLSKEMDRTLKAADGVHRQLQDLMSGDWSWEQADILAQDPANHGAMFAPIILGSDKTTVSVATGQNDYYPLYASLGNVQNHVRRAHRNALTVVGFLAIPKADREHQDSAEFRKFRRQLVHASLVRILASLKPWMTKPRLTYCGDGHYRRVIYGLGPYIADYPKACLLSAIVSGWCPKCAAYPHHLDGDPGDAVLRSHRHTRYVAELCDGKHKRMWDSYGILGDIEPFTSYFPRANIHDLLAPDILHQLIKGVFKDHLVTWIVTWIEAQPDGKKRLAEFDRRVNAAPHFSELRRFPDGRGFKQWTGDDSKALMKVIVPAIDGLVPRGMVCAVSAFMEFCYLARRSILEDRDLDKLDMLLEEFHQEREIFRELGIRDHFNLPRQHSLRHYRLLIQRFGAPNGLCSSITESQHIKDVKEPYRRSNRNQPLGQMITTIQRTSQLTAFEIHLRARGILNMPLPWARHTGTIIIESLSYPSRYGDTCAEINIYLTDTTIVARARYQRSLLYLQLQLRLPLEALLRRFLYEQLHPNPSEAVELSDCPFIDPLMHIKINHSVRAIFSAPSDRSNIRCLRQEIIRATPNWKNTGPRHDCVFINDAPGEGRCGFTSLGVAQVQLFFTFEHDQITYPCALVHWFRTVGDEPSSTTRMWKVKPLYNGANQRVQSIVHANSIVRSAHLVGVYGEQFLDSKYTYQRSNTAFKSYYVNKFVDHHAYEIAF